MFFKDFIFKVPISGSVAAANDVGESESYLFKRALVGLFESHGFYRFPWFERPVFPFLAVSATSFIKSAGNKPNLLRLE